MASERQIHVGGVAIGGGAPVVVQSMTTTETADADATLGQIAELAEAGCEIVRVAVPGRSDADALPTIVAASPLPVIADIHFNASLALRAMDAGVAAVRINPGNIGGPDKVEQVVRRAKETGTPMRIGANSGSLPDHLRQFATNDPAGALVEAALEEVRLLERLDYREFKISVKSSSVPMMIACPSCGRTNVEVLELAERVQERLDGYDEVFEVAVMGCAVNGPGEAGDADFGIAGGRDAGFIYAHGQVLRKVEQAQLVEELFREVDAWIAGGMVRPERKTRKHVLPMADVAAAAATSS